MGTGKTGTFSAPHRILHPPTDIRSVQIAVHPVMVRVFGGIAGIRLFKITNIESVLCDITGSTFWTR